MRGHTLSIQSAHFVDLITILRKNVSKGSDRKRRKLARFMFHRKEIRNPPRKCFRCGSEYHMIVKCPKPPKDNEKRQKQVRFNEKGNRACNNGEDKDDHKIYASMAQMSSDDERKSGEYGDSS